MAPRDDFELPVDGQPVQDAAGRDDPSCSPTAYVSQEEAALVAAMRQLRERAVAVRQEFSAARSEQDRTRMEAELAALRDRWSELVVRREAAYRRKMVMLGHLPPEALWE